MIIVEHFPEVVLNTIKFNADVYEWFINDWIHLVAVNPQTLALSRFKHGAFVPYTPLRETVARVADMTPIIEKETDNIAVHIVS
jgi:hypothetical protein